MEIKTAIELLNHSIEGCIDKECDMCKATRLLLSLAQKVFEGGMIEKIVTFEENGGEYYGLLIIKCDILIQKDKNTIIVNNAEITIDEDIVDISNYNHLRGK